MEYHFKHNPPVLMRFDGASLQAQTVSTDVIMQVVMMLSSLCAYTVAFVATAMYYCCTALCCGVQASIELQGIKGMWSLRPGSDAEFDKYLVQAFTSGTFITRFYAAIACSVIALNCCDSVHQQQLNTRCGNLSVQTCSRTSTAISLCALTHWCTITDS
jgi:hypothetical protein